LTYSEDLVGNASLNSKSLKTDKFDRKNLSYEKEAIIAFSRYYRLNNIQCSRNIPCCWTTCWPNLPK